MTIGYNLSSCVIDLHAKVETNLYRKSNQRNDENAELITQMDDLHRLLSAINTHRDTRKNSIDFHDSEEIKDLINKVRGYAPDLMEPYTYSWQGEEDIKGLVENLNNYIKTITPKMAEKGIEIQQMLHELNQLLDIVAETAKNDRNSTNAIIRKLLN